MIDSTQRSQRAQRTQRAAQTPRKAGPFMIEISFRRSQRLFPKEVLTKLLRKEVSNIKEAFQACLCMHAYLVSFALFAIFAIFALNPLTATEHS